MTGWIIFLGIFAVLLFLLLCRIRVEFSYSETFQLEIRYLFLRFPLLPGKQKGLGKASPKPGKSGRKKRKNSSQTEKKTAGRRRKNFQHYEYSPQHPVRGRSPASAYHY